jgi:hydroxymethylpyrimidine/phosphomethylpyrimidine kinase
MANQRSRRSPAFDRRGDLARGRQSAATVPVALTIAGSDCSAGAGIQADLKTFAALRVYGLTAVTCIVAEIPGKVSRIETVTARMIREQIEVLLRNFEVGAIKTGMLCSAQIISAVAKAIQDSDRIFGRHVPLVVDPVMIATSGDCLVESGAIEAYKNELFPLATLITPNLDEAKLLTAGKIKNLEQMEQAAETLATRFRCSILLKGGHLRGNKAIDLLFHNGHLIKFSAPFVRGVATHGTGCTYSAAITAGLASGLSLVQAIRRAKKFVTKSIAQYFQWKRGAAEIDALNHSI